MMKLYHTSNSFYTLKEGLKANFKHEDTKAINKLLNKYNHGNGCFDRDHCIFLILDKRTHCVITYSIDLDALDINKLYIANQWFSDALYMCCECNELTDEIVKEAANKYISSIQKFSLDKINLYDNLELFYTGDIPSNFLTIENIDRDEFSDFINNLESKKLENEYFKILLDKHEQLTKQ